MVIRKPLPPGTIHTRQNPLPYPVTPTSPNRADPLPPKLPSPSEQNGAFSPNLHESPAFNLRSIDQAQNAQNLATTAAEDEDEDPWADEDDDDPGRKKGPKPTPKPKPSKLPSVLRPGHKKVSPAQPKKTEELPDLLKAGVSSNEGTPRSSFESQASGKHDFGLDGVSGSKSQDDGGRGQAARRASKSARENAVAGNISLPLGTEPGGSTGQTVGPLSPARESSLWAAFKAPMPGAPRLQSNNPFRRPSDEAPPADAGAESSAAAWGEQPLSSEGKGKQKAESHSGKSPDSSV